MKPPNSDANRPGNVPGARPPEAPKTSAPQAPAPGAPGAKPDAAKTDAAKIDASKADLGKTDLVKPDPTRVDAIKPAAAPGDTPKPPASSPQPGPTKPGEATKTVPMGGPSAANPSQANPSQAKPGETKPGETRPADGKVEPAKEAAKPDAPKTATFASGPQGTVRPGAPATDGPIIDLKAKRLPDPAPAQKTSATGAGITPGVATKPVEGKPMPVEGKPVETNPTGTKPGGAGTTDAKVAEPKAADPKAGVGGSTGDAARSAGGATPRITPTPAVAPAARGPGFGSVATAGLLGGVIGAGLLFAVERAGVLPKADDGQSAALDQRIAALAPRDEVARLSQRVASNETALKAVPEAVSTAREALQKASAAPAAGVDGAPAPTAPALPADLAARLDSLDQRLSALQEEPGQQGGEARMAVQPANGDATQIAALADRLKAVETQVAAVPKPAEQPDLGPKLAALQTALDDRAKANADATRTLGQKLTEVQQALDTKVQAATQASQQAADAAKVQAAEAARDAAKGVERQIQAQGEKIAGLDKALSERAEVATVQAALRVVSADRIVTALNTGTPYADALSALRNLEPGDPTRLTAVAVFADRGAPTARELAAEFRPVAEKVAASRRAAQVRTVAETGDFGQKLMSMAESIVQVRKVETPAPSAAGTAPAADPMPKVQDALDRGAIAEAAQAFAALPEDARSQAGEFGTKLKSRAAAGEAAQALLSEAFKGLPATGPAR